MWINVEQIKVTCNDKSNNCNETTLQNNLVDKI